MATYLQTFDATATWANAALATLQEIGLKVRFAADGFVVGLAWRRQLPGTGSRTQHLRLWRVSTQALLVDVSQPTDNGLVGWQWSYLSLPVAVTAGVDYMISTGWQNGDTRGQDLTHAFTSTPADYVIPASYAYSVNATWSFPTTDLANAGVFPMDVEWSPSDTPVTPQPATPADVSHLLTDWLDTVEGTQAHSAPLQDHATLATVDTNVADVKDQQNDWAFGLGAAAHGYFGDLKGLIADIKTITDTLPTPIAQLTSIVLDHYTADIDLILGQIDSVLSNLGAQSTDLSGTAGSAVGALSGRTGFPATGWTMSAEADFEDAIAFAEVADVYVLSITSYQPTQPATESPAGLWLPRLGWWCVLNGALATQRQFVDFQQMILEDQGRRMPGCAIQLKPGTLATVQAWLLA